ncbi:hypothetical protein PSTT_02402 [Puccinia striiformis]|uniref:Uncharacterized protein n=1 Tax=Puccinia striiformis TaxID=27350 RepID=A0A2S4W054_9BASI|nr:hypothetical protein PSTT_02402 [Puccinia striiformis]
MSDSVAVANTSEALRVTDAPTNVTSTPDPRDRIDDDEEITSILGMNNDVAPSELGDSPEQDTGSLPIKIFSNTPSSYQQKHFSGVSPLFLFVDLFSSPPRRIYERPQKNDEGKRPKEKLFKRVVRLYQKEVRKGEQLKRKEIPNEGKFRSVIKARGALVRGAHMMSNWLPSSCVETLARVPPKHKLGEILVLFPEFSGETRPEESEQPYQPSEEDLLHDLNVLLRKTKKGIVVRLVVVSALLPIAAGIDFFAPVFFVEISIAYLAFQVYGLRKVKALTSKKSKSKKSKASAAKAKAKSQQQVTDGTSAEAVEIRAEDSASNPTEDGPDSYFRVKAIDVATIEPVMKLLYNICTRIDPLCFPPPEGQEIDASERFETVPAEQGGSGIESTDPAVPAKTVLPPTLHRPAPEMVREMVRVFKENLSPEVVERYDLDEERLANDLARYLKKASDDPESGMIKRTSKWFSKRGVIKRERKDKRAVKKQIKTEVAQQIAADQAEADRILSENQQTSTPSDSTEPLTPKAEKKLKKQLQKEEKILKKSQKASTNKKGKNPEVVA